MISILIFILILSVLVLIHELGHFIMAKRGGIGVEEFGFGIPPRIWGKKIGETLYSINWLPFGGFVKLVGEDSVDRVQTLNSYQIKSLGRRIAVVLAGVFMNLVLAVVVFYIVLFAQGFKVSMRLYLDHNFKFVNQSREVAVAPITGSAAEQAGIKIGDAILEANGMPIGSAEELQKVIGENQDKPITLTLEDTITNKTREVAVTPVYNESLKGAAIGVNIEEIAVLSYKTLPQKLFSGFIHSYNTIDYSFRIFGSLIGYSISRGDFRPISEGVSGPVGIAQITSQVASLGVIPVLQLVGILSLNLAVMNVLPIPALDGGRFLFLVIEAVTRRRVYPQVEKWTHTIGFALLMGLLLLITWNDILKLVR